MLWIGACELSRPPTVDEASVETTVLQTFVKAATTSLTKLLTEDIDIESFAAQFDAKEDRSLRTDSFWQAHFQNSVFEAGKPEHSIEPALVSDEMEQVA